ncbi:helix-turn-helix domain-containing protein [Croceibacterium ferulae]|uniref:helix-turn-helix domain-containing protein n=1 Tax=Croceibacterium ferulae TaxID=1854641 RepID=UPI000F86E8AF|nr:helix-turn-helix transcriptional regulator [Croceibacterium ferulae]
MLLKMKALHLSQGELARRVGCSGASMSKIVQGETKQSRLLPAIARELGVSVAYLVGETDEAVLGLCAGILSPEESYFITQLRVLTSSDEQAVFRILDTLARSYKSSGICLDQQTPL